MCIDMFIEPENDPRTEPPPQGGELATLSGFLRWQRGDPAVVAEAWRARRDEVAAAQVQGPVSRLGQQLAQGRQVDVVV